MAEITLLNTFNLKNTAAEKESILDIKAKDAKGRIYNIEMQSIGNQVYRSLYYWARSYSEQLKEGSIYKDLQPVICINLLDFDLFPESRKAHQCFLLTEQRPPHEVLSEHCMLHFISLPKATHGQERTTERARAKRMGGLFQQGGSRHGGPDHTARK